MSYLHGVEIKQQEGLAVLRAGETAIIGLVGIAEQGDTELTLVTNLTDAKAKYGEDLPGTTIISALKSIYKDGNAPVLVVNVATPTMQSDMMDGANVGVESGGEFYTEIYESQIEATANSLTGLTLALTNGIKKLKDAGTFGMKVNFIIVPGYSQVQTIYMQMRTTATEIKGKAIIDLYADTVPNALVERANNHSYSDKRVILCFPNMVQYNDYKNVDVTVSLSQLLAAAFVTVHNKVGFWQSPSNTELPTVKKPVININSSLTDSGADNQLLNAQGIVTIFSANGTGIRLWGNWTSALRTPGAAELKGMIAASIVEDVIEETLLRESLRFMDKNIGYAALDFVVQSVQNFLNTQKSAGALIDGRIWFTKEKNPVANVQAGQFVFDYDFCPHPSLDRLTYESYMNIEYLNNLFK